MTNSKIFQEVGCPEELKRYKREIIKLRKIIDILETDLSVKEMTGAYTVFANNGIYNKPTFITSFYLPTEQKSELTALLKPFGSITMFDVDARINQLREIVDQVSVAVEFILVLVLLAGTLVLVAQVQASMDERRQEIAILRTLGAKGALIRQSVIFEFVIIGSVAGFMAALANELSLYMLQTSVFKMKASLHSVQVCQRVLFSTLRMLMMVNLLSILTVMVIPR